jgi:hypothetical protein
MHCDLTKSDLDEALSAGGSANLQPGVRLSGHKRHIDRCQFGYFAMSL